MKYEKDKAMTVYEKLRNKKQPMNLWEHVRNHQFKIEMQRRREEQLKHTPQAPEYAEEHINWL